MNMSDSSKYPVKLSFQGCTQACFFSSSSFPLPPSLSKKSSQVILICSPREEFWSKLSIRQRLRNEWHQTQRTNAFNKANFYVFCELISQQLNFYVEELFETYLVICFEMYSILLGQSIYFDYLKKVQSIFCFRSWTFLQGLFPDFNHS